MSQLEIQILHQDYVLTCPDGKENFLREAAERVDQQFKDLRNNARLRSRERVGVLLAVNLAYENLELRSQIHALQTQLATPQMDINGDAMLGLAQQASLIESLQAQYAHDANVAAELTAQLDAALLRPVSTQYAAPTPLTESFPTQVQAGALTPSPSIMEPQPSACAPESQTADGLCCTEYAASGPQ